MVIRLMEAGDFTAYPGGLRFMTGVRGVGLRLAAAGADIVVTSLDQVDVAALADGRLATLKG